MSNRLIRAAAALVFSIVSGAALAQTAYPFQEYGAQIQAAKTIGPVGAGAFGESTSNYSGQTEFNLVDIDLPGNDQLPVRLGRRFVIEDRDGSRFLGGFGEWDIDVPYIEGTFQDGTGWTVAAPGSADKNKRCSLGAGPYFDRPAYSINEVWHGYNVHIPGEGDRELLKALTDANGVPSYGKPTDGRIYPWVTRDNDRVSCDAVATNDLTGEGYVLVTPNGVRYYFTYAVERWVRGLRKGPTPDLILARKRVYLLATKVEDRFGNAVYFDYANDRLQAIRSSDGVRRIDLQYNNSNNELITSATANGRQWTYSYASDHLASVRNPDNTTWTYESAGGALKTISENVLVGFDPFQTDEPDCDMQEPDTGGAYIYKVTHPSGATATFTFKMKRNYRLNVPYQCFIDVAPHDIAANTQVDWNFTEFDSNLYNSLVASGMDAETARDMATVAIRTDSVSLQTTTHVAGYMRLGIPNFSDTFALVAKDVSAQGVATATTTFDYGTVGRSGFCGHYGGTNCIDFCQIANCDHPPGTKWTSVTLPDHSVVKRLYGVKYDINEGQLLQEQLIAADGVTVLRDTAYGYVTNEEVASQPFPDRIGGKMTPDPMGGKMRPQKTRIIHQQGVDFSQSVDVFDTFARPLTVTRESTLGYTRADTFEYSDNTAKWVLGQVARTTQGGTEVDKTVFNSDALPTQTSHFGLVVNNLAYSGGLLASVTDNRGKVTNVGNWFAGVPRQIIWADGFKQTATVTNDGWITHTTDWLSATQPGTEVNYSYDAMGRLTGTDNVTAGEAWNATDLSFAPATSAEITKWGLYWKRVEKTGNGSRTTFLDKLWHPVLTIAEDVTIPGTASYVVNRFDVMGRVIFTSYPVATLTTVDDVLNGTKTEYDVMGRVTKITKDSEVGPLVTSTQYSEPFRTIVTDPRNIKTRTDYQAFDQPATDAPVSILTALGLPDQQMTTISRQHLGQPTLMERKGTWNGAEVKATRYYFYDSNRRLCKIVEPESGATIINYDAASNIDWTATGRTSTGSSCDRSTAVAPVSVRTLHTYDARNRPLTIDYPTGDDTTFAYTVDGDLATLVNGNSTWNYTYNGRNQPLTETLTTTFNGVTKVRTLAHEYNANGFETRATYPSSLVVNFNPNGLGQDERAGPWLTGVTYHPNGAMKGYTTSSCSAGDCLVHSMTQNIRGLPATVQLKRANDAALIADAYTYDRNGNILTITDTSSIGGGSRTMSYDLQDRLASASATAQWWRKISFTYDPLDNIRSRTFGNDPAITTDDEVWTYTYDNDPTTGRNLLQSMTKVLNGVTTPTTFGYDSIGNTQAITPTGGTARAFVFDGANRLTEVTGKEKYAYDGHGRRTWIEDQGAAKKVAYTMYDLAGRLVADEDQRNSTLNEYVYLNGSLVAKRTAAMATPTSWNVRYTFTDALGSPIVETDTAAALKRAEKYLPYGEQTDGVYDRGPSYAGHVTDGGTGLIYMQQRYYDPAIGRFLSRDPVAARLKGDNFNRYAYARNNPYKFMDPDGREAGGGYATGLYKMEGESVENCDDICLTMAGAIYTGPLFEFAGSLIGGSRLFAGFAEARAAAVSAGRISRALEVAEGRISMLPQAINAGRLTQAEAIAAIERAVAAKENFSMAIAAGAEGSQVALATGQLGTLSGTTSVFAIEVAADGTATYGKAFVEVSRKAADLAFKVLKFEPAK